MIQIRTYLVELRTRLMETLAARDAAITGGDAALQQAEVDHKAACDASAKKLKEDLAAHEAQTQRQREALEQKCKQGTDRAAATFSRLRTRLQAPIQAKITALKNKQKRIHAEADKARDDKMAALEAERSVVASQLTGCEATAQELNTKIAACAKEHGVPLDPIRFKEPIDHVPTSFDAAGKEIAKRLVDTRASLDEVGPKLRRRMPGLLPYALVIVMHAGAWGYTCSFATDSPYVLYIGGSLLLFFGIIYSVRFSHKTKVYAAGMGLSQSVSTIRALIERQTALLNTGMEQATLDVANARAQEVGTIDAEVEQQTKENNRLAAEIAGRLQVFRDKLTAKIARRKQADLMRLDREAKERAAELQAQQQQALQQLQQDYAARKRKIEDDRKAEIARQAAKWKQILGEADAFAADAMKRQREVFPPWSGFSLEQALPTEFRPEVYTGGVKVNLKLLAPESDAEGPFSIPETKTLPLPLPLTFPLEGSLCIRAGINRRDQALEMLFGSVLRILSSCPPGKAKLTVIDPIGLGQSFSALMHLADYDESLVTNRIWCETTHIERRLSELTEHMEKVIQKYLRNRYNSIDEYNKEAGQLAEPYRFLVIADFPNGFSELAVEKLASIISSGVRCGVYTLIMHDSRQKLPVALDDTQFKRNGLLIAEGDDGFVAENEPLRRAAFIAEEPPAAQTIDALLHGLGKQCRNAMRVQVPFESASPKPEEYWSASAETGIRLPLGKSGADRLQYLDLGQGTTQHALIAGKTGSGKSNLFHVIITNASLWYSPREIEFYLIDFKKGVEFKPYGTLRLPHARVVAIESDREFGLSVLRRIDKELGVRGELFRKARVQDYANYRKVAADKPLPRALLVIDEFQEFFTDEDGVSQESALLLDRLIRQGRAFGIHVVLGTQTLGGTYSLAKSTLGQIAVRIALQCNEADSSMILSDDNLAASLLSRPGEAIYNDMSGLVEGNNPFQAVFFPQGTQDPYIRVLQKKAAETKLQPAEPTVVFEGNEFAELRNNSLFTAQVARKVEPSEVGDRIWLGEPNAIKGPTDARFLRQSGANLLVIGERGDAQLAMCSASILCLASGSAPKNISIRVLDGTLPDSGGREHLNELVQALPHDIKIVDFGDVPQLIEELGGVLKARQEHTDESTTRHYLLVLGLDKFRMLRQADEFSFSSSDSEGGASPADAFGKLLSDGPNHGLHSIVWCDKLTNLNRFFNRKTLREFEIRVLYQMSATDSSELIDNPAANRLGLYNALLFTSQSGGVEKFRPYAVPDRALIAEVGAALKKRG